MLLMVRSLLMMPCHFLQIIAVPLRGLLEVKLDGSGEMMIMGCGVLPCCGGSMGLLLPQTQTVCEVTMIEPA